jgi:hypothetical protein
MLILINKKIIYIALTIELNKIILYFSEGKFRSHILEVNYNNASDIKEILNNLIFKAVENLSFILNLNKSLEIYLNTSLEYYEQFKNRIFELIFEKNEVCLYMTYEKISQKLFSFENFDQKFIINTIIDIESKLNVLKKICYEVRCAPYSPKEIYVPNYLSDMHMFFYFNFNTFKDFKNNLSFKFTDKSEFAADYPEKVHLTISLEWPTEKVLIESLSKFRSIEQFFEDLKKLAKLCDLTNNIINIEVKNNKIIIKIIDDKEYTKGKEYVYDNVNLENLHEKILIHLNNWL